MKKKKALTGAQRVKGSHDRKIAAGLRLIKIYVAKEKPGVKTEADRIRTYAAKQPETKKRLAAARV